MTQGEWKIQLTIATNFLPSKDTDETHTMHSKSDNVLSNETDEMTGERFESLLQKCQSGLEKGMRGSEFVFDSVDLLYYKLHKISLNRTDHIKILQKGWKTKRQR